MIEFERNYGFLNRRWLLICGLVAGIGAVTAAHPQPAQGEVLLTVLPGGEDDATAVTFDLAALDALPQQDILTHTPWTDGAHRYTGPSLRAVLDHAGIGQGTIRLEAVNDYQTVFAAPDPGAAYPIVATRIDGETYGMRQNGPLWIMFPFDADDAWHSADFYSQAVWQLVRIVAVELP